MADMGFPKIRVPFWAVRRSRSFWGPNWGLPV